MRLWESEEEPTPSFGWTTGPTTGRNVRNVWMLGAMLGITTGRNVRMLGAMLGIDRPRHRRAQQLQILALSAPHVASAAEGAQVSAVRLMPGLNSVVTYE